MPEIPRPRALRDVGLAMIILTKLADTSVSLWALSTLNPIRERNGLAAAVYSRYDVAGMYVLSVVAILMLFVVVELGAKYIKRKTHGTTRKKNLQTIFIVGYWVPGLLWAWVSIYNGWLVWAVVNASHPLMG